MTKRQQMIWKILMLLYLVAVAYICFAPGDSIPQLPKWNIPIPMDKLVHFTLFLPFPIVAFFAFNLKGSFKNICLLFLVGIVLAGLTELIQSFSPTRSMEAFDFLADSIGISLSCLLLIFLRKAYGGDGKSRGR